MGVGGHAAGYDDKKKWLVNIQKKMKSVICEIAKYYSDFKKCYKKGVLVTSGTLVGLQVKKRESENSV